MSAINKRLLIICIVSILSACNANQIKNAMQIVDSMSSQSLDEGTIVAGLKQALEVGTQHAVTDTSVVGGFSNNPLIKIVVPEELEGMANSLRSVGFSRLVNNFELMMNRSAELASNEAKVVFFDAIKNMSIGDAFGILNGGEHAATNYFRNQTEQTLRTRYQPIISNQMNKIGFYSDYRQLLTTYEALPFADKPELDIEEHIADSALDGLFSLLAGEEAKIRHDPVARTTELLRRVFAR